MPTRSAAFERFRFSFFEDPDSARQGLDTPALAGLAGEERERAEAMLIAFLPDSRAIIGLGVLGSSKAEPHLAALFEAERLAQRASKLQPEASWLPYRLLHLATALWRIRPDPRWPLAAIDVLGSASGADRAAGGRRGAVRCSRSGRRSGARRSSRRPGALGALPCCARAPCDQRSVRRLQGPAAHALPADGGRGFTARRRQARRPRRRCRSAARRGLG